MAASFLPPLLSVQLEIPHDNISMSFHLSTDTDMHPTPFRIATEYTNTEAAAMALDHQLYIKDHPSQKHLISAKHLGSTPCMIAVDRYGTPVGMILVKSRLVYIYVNRQCRLQGVGTMLINALKQRRGPNFRDEGMIGTPGIKGWDTFFKKNKVACLTVVK